MTVAEALDVLKEAATTRRSQAALEALTGEIERLGTDESSSGKPPRFPDAKSIAEQDESDADGAKGGATAGDGQGPATARKGS